MTRCPEEGEKPGAQHVLWPPVRDQIFYADAVTRGGQRVDFGDNAYSAVDMNLGPEDPRPFMELVATLGRDRIPWRAAIVVEGCGRSARQLKDIGASFLSMFPGNNDLRRAFAFLRQAREQEILDNYRPREGMILVSGATGSGKSTLIAGLIKAKIEEPAGNYDIVEAAAPVEFLLERVKGPSSTMNQTGIPRDLPTFATFVRGAMRREPTDIIVGECRDSETMSAAVQAALSGHTLTTTVHANNVSLTMQRVASLCSADERDNLISAVAQSLRLIVNQRLARSADGRRTALRGILVFDAALHNELLRADPSNWLALTQRAVGRKASPIAFRSSGR